MENEQATVLQMIEMVLQSQQMMANAFFQLAGQFHALKNMVCALHPEIAMQLEENIQKSSHEFAEQHTALQQRFALIAATLSKTVH